MKQTNILSVLIILIIILILTGCVKDESFEIGPQSNRAMVSSSSAGIVFEFYLLNENGMKSTMFNEGENFSFCYTVTNNRKKAVEYYPREIYTNIDFFAVKSSNGDFYERPSGMPGVLKEYKGVWINSGETLVFNTPWIDNRESWIWELATFFPVNLQPLPKGDYYTEFTSDLDFNHRGLHVENFTFRINFKIE